jgi:hypothetical protein
VDGSQLGHELIPFVVAHGASIYEIFRDSCAVCSVPTGT